MPLVVMNCKKGRLLGDMIGNLANELPAIVARALHVEKNLKGHLTSEDIEVEVRESGPYDVNIKDLEITIWANDYPERLANLDKRREEILSGIREFLRDYDRNLSGFVWVLLQPASFGEL